MKLKRSSKCYFSKWITPTKQTTLDNIMKEYSRVVNLFIGRYQKEIPKKSKYDLLRKEHIHTLITAFVVIMAVIMALYIGGGGVITWPWN